jgi:1H-pyrrole-2-carbonyl-[peptidyl-carrier protein] chlorinase
MNHSVPDFDVAIVGGGPAGSSMASYLAQAGLKCVVFEGEDMPREHVGESLVPSSTRILRDLDFLPKMEASGFPKKYGAAWTAASGSPAYAHSFHSMDFDGLHPGSGADIRFEEREGDTGQKYTWHVDRGRFDLMMLQHSNELGAEVYQGVRVNGVDFDADPGFASVKYSMGKKQMTTSCRIAVDASGRHTLIGNQMKWKVKDSMFNQYAIHTWFEDYNRTSMAYKEGMNNYIFIHFLPISNTWVWQIPISETITSVGVVTQKENFAARKEDREQFFWNAIKTRPEFYEALCKGRQLRPFKDEGDYSYAMKQIVSDRLMMIGDAARFVDPIFSTGVSIALTCSQLGHKDIIRAVETGNFKKAAFSDYETTLKRGVRNWYNFIRVYYRLNVLFTAFISDPRYRVDVIQLLQGDVYEEKEPAVLTRMRDIVSSVERNPNHVWHNLLGNLTANAFAEVNEAMV